MSATGTVLVVVVCCCVMLLIRFASVGDVVRLRVRVSVGTLMSTVLQELLASTCFRSVGSVSFRGRDVFSCLLDGFVVYPGSKNLLLWGAGVAKRVRSIKFKVRMWLGTVWSRIRWAVGLCPAARTG